MNPSRFIQWLYDNWHYMVGDTTSATIVIGTVLDILPSIAAALSIIWVCLRIYESQTVQNFLYFRKRQYPPPDYYYDDPSNNEK